MNARLFQSIDRKKGLVFVTDLHLAVYFDYLSGITGCSVDPGAVHGITMEEISSINIDPVGIDQIYKYRALNEQAEELRSATHRIRAKIMGIITPSLK